MKLRLTTSSMYRIWLLIAILFALLDPAPTIFSANALSGNSSQHGSANLASLRSFEIAPLETVSETTANASVGDLNGDGHLDILLAKGRRWPLASVVLLGDGKGAIYGMAVGDFDGDEWPDIAVARSDAPCFVMFNRPAK